MYWPYKTHIVPSGWYGAPKIFVAVSNTLDRSLSRVIIPELLLSRSRIFHPSLEWLSHHRRLRYRSQQSLVLSRPRSHDDLLQTSHCHLALKDCEKNHDAMSPFSSNDASFHASKSEQLSSSARSLPPSLHHFLPPSLLPHRNPDVSVVDCCSSSACFPLHCAEPRPGFVANADSRDGCLVRGYDDWNELTHRRSSVEMV